MKDNINLINYIEKLVIFLSCFHFELQNTKNILEIILHLK